MTVWSKLGLLGKCHFISISGEILIEKGPSQGVLASLHRGWGGPQGLVESSSTTQHSSAVQVGCCRDAQYVADLYITYCTY